VPADTMAVRWAVAVMKAVGGGGAVVGPDWLSYCIRRSSQVLLGSVRLHEDPRASLSGMVVVAISFAGGGRPTSCG
jgi:hypothetical protein